MKRIIIAFLLISSVFARICIDVGSDEWCYDQSTSQAFYMLEATTVDGAVVDSEDLIGAFFNGVCVGFINADPNGYTTVPLMGDDGSFPDYMKNGDVADLVLYDASNGSTLNLTPGSDLPGWSLNEIYIIGGTSTATNVFGCTDDSACNYNSDATANDGSCLSLDCNGDCGGSAEVDDCGVCDGGNADQDCAGVCFGASVDTWCDGSCGETGPVNDACGVCDGDESTCTGCTDDVADNTNEGCADDTGCLIDDGSCEYTVPSVTGLSAEGGPGRVNLSWDAPDQMGTSAYTYIVLDGNSEEVKSTSSTQTSVTGLDPGVEACFSVVASNDYGDSRESDLACATPEASEGISWGLKLVASIDGWGTFEEVDEHNYLGVAPNSTYGFDPTMDIVEPNPGQGNYISLYFPHEEWDAWVGDNFTQDVVLEDEDFFAHNITTWSASIISNMAGEASVEFSYLNQPQSVPIYVEVITIESNDGEEYMSNFYPVEEGTTIDFFLQQGIAQDIRIHIGNIVPQAPSGLSSDGGDRSISLDWRADEGDLEEKSNRYPATSFNIYRDGEPNDPNSGLTSDHLPGGAGLIASGLTGTDYLDDEDIYGGGEGLLHESSYSYTVTGSNDAGESSEGHIERTSGGIDTWFDGRDSRTSSTTADNIDPVSITAHVASDDGTNLGEGHYEIPHNNDPDENRITIHIDGGGSEDIDAPYEITRYEWSQIAGNNDLEDLAGADTDNLSFTVGNLHENGAKSYSFNLHVESDYQVKDTGGDGVWTSRTATRMNDSEISITVEEEPNADPVASAALDLIEHGDGLSVLTSDDYDASDMNDYDSEDQVWYEPHDNSGDQNNADLYFSADDSSDDDVDDELFYSWSLARGSEVGFSFDDSNANGEYDAGEPFWTSGGGEEYVNFEAQEGNGENEIDLSLSLDNDVYILTQTVTDIYGDSDTSVLVVDVRDERNAAPVADSHRVQPTWYINHNDDNRDVFVDTDCDGLGASDSDNDDLDFDWSYSGPDNISLDEFDSSFNRDLGGSFKSATADLGVGTHTFTFTVTDSYGASSSASTTFNIVNEPGAVAANIEVTHEDLKYAIIDVSENRLDDFAVDCHGEVYGGDDFNTGRLDLLRDGAVIMSWDDSDGADSGTRTHIDETLDAETTYTYTVESFNSDLDDQEDGIASSSDSATTGNRPTVTVLDPNGNEIKSVGDDFTVSFSTTDANYISKIELFYEDGSSADLYTDETGTNVDGSAAGNETTSYVINDASARLGSDGLHNGGINYDAAVRIVVHDVGDYNGENSQSNEDSSDDTFTMANHTLNRDFAEGWHLFGSPMDAVEQDGSALQTDNFGSLGNWGEDWLVFDVDGQYENLETTEGEGFYMLLQGDNNLEITGNPILLDPDTGDSQAVELGKGWNLIANPLVTYQGREELTFSDGSETKSWYGAWLAGWVQPSVIGWFGDSHAAYDVLAPWGGYWINTSRELSVEFRPYNFDNTDLGRSQVASGWDLIRKDIEARYDNAWSMVVSVTDGMKSDAVVVATALDAENDFVYGEDQYKLDSQSADEARVSLAGGLMSDIKSSQFKDYVAWNLSFENFEGPVSVNADLSETSEDVHLVVDGESYDLTEGEVTVSAGDHAVIVLGSMNAYNAPDSFALGSAYPNPFNPTTQLDLGLSESGYVTMKVYNVMGQMVDVLVDGNMDAGLYPIVWNASDLSSGVYFVKVEAGQNIATQKIMLVK